MNSGWAAKAVDSDAFRGTDASGGYHFPGFSAAAADYLLNRRKIAGLGVDTLSKDSAVAEGAPVHHQIALGPDKIGLECLNNMERMPRQGCPAHHRGGALRKRFGRPVSGRSSNLKATVDSDVVHNAPRSYMTTCDQDGAYW